MMVHGGEGRSRHTLTPQNRHRRWVPSSPVVSAVAAMLVIFSAVLHNIHRYRSTTPQSNLDIVKIVDGKSEVNEATNSSVRRSMECILSVPVSSLETNGREMSQYRLMKAISLAENCLNNYGEDGGHRGQNSEFDR